LDGRYYFVFQVLLTKVLVVIMPFTVFGILLLTSYLAGVGLLLTFVQ